MANARLINGLYSVYFTGFTDTCEGNCAKYEMWFSTCNRDLIDDYQLEEEVISLEVYAGDDLIDKATHACHMIADLFDEEDSEPCFGVRVRLWSPDQQFSAEYDIGRPLENGGATDLVVTDESADKSFVDEPDSYVLDEDFGFEIEVDGECTCFDKTEFHDLYEGDKIFHPVHGLMTLLNKVGMDTLHVRNGKNFHISGGVEYKGIDYTGYLVAIV